MPTSTSPAGPATTGAQNGPASTANALRRAVGLGARLGLVALTTWIGTSLHLPWGPWADVLVGVLMGLALLGLGNLTWSFLRWAVTGWPRYLGTPTLVATAGALALLLGFASVPPLVALAVWGVWFVTGAAVVLALAALRDGLVRAAVRAPRWRPIGLATAATLVAAAAMTWWWWPGGADDVAPLRAGAAVPLTLDDPSAPGPLPVATLRYGSGTPRWRPEYGADAALQTAPIDLAELVELGPIARPARRLALGSGLDAVPRNAIVWYPATGDGPFPLLLIAHGNANLFTPSEDGYGYLGEHLASHGFVVASIDAAAFNALPVVGGLRGENHARALLLLAHLDLWREWQARGEPLLPRVDLARVALAGHSRGGEAAAIAAALDRLGRLPADARSPLAERVGGPHEVRAVIAIAPSDGQYRVGDRPTTLHGVDYLVLHGGFDADVSSFVGERQYERTHPGPEGFKAAVYVHHANHGQFNETWGRFDQMPPLSRLLRTAAIMPAAEQRRVATTLFTAFLRASLLGEDEYREVFRDPRRGLAWLPATAYVTRFDDGTGVVLMGGDDGVDPLAGRLPDSHVSAEGLALWRVGDPGYRRGVARDATTVTLGWTSEPGEAPASYTLHLPLPLADLVTDPDATFVTLDVGRGERALPDGTAPPTGPLDVSLVLVADDGERASLPLASAQGIPPHLPTVVTRLPPFETVRYRPDAYPLFQRIDVPLADLLATNPDLDLGRTRAVALVFDQVPAGVLTLRSLQLTAR